MDPLMRIPRTGLTEGLPAVLTRVGFLPGVDPNMDLQVAPVRETFAANVA